jgi:hypothetical protein
VTVLRSADRLDDLVVLQKVAARLWPRGSHPGGLGWELAIDQSYPELQLAVDNDTVVGWAGRSDGHIEVHADQDAVEATRALLVWALEASGTAAVSIPVYDGDTTLGDALQAAGFVPDDQQPPIYGMFHDVIAQAPAAPDGYRVRGLADGEGHARVEAHRAAWRPKTLPQ